MRISSPLPPQNSFYFPPLQLSLPTMEALSLLKYWKGADGASGGEGSGNTRKEPETTTIVAAHREIESDEENEEDGPFIDLEFAVPDEKEEGEKGNDENGSESDGENRSDPNSDDLFRLVPIEANSSIDSKLTQFPASLMKSATKIRVFLLRFKKSKGEKTEEAAIESATAVIPKKLDGIQEENSKSRFFTVKFKVEEVPIVSLFAGNKSQKPPGGEESVSDEKKFSKDVMQKYLKKVKPLYVRVSKRYGEKLRFSGPLSPGVLKPTTVQPSTAADTTEKAQPEPEVGVKHTNLKTQKSVNFPAGFKVVRKHLGKSKSASSVVVAAPSPVLSQRRDDSLLQQLDGIQSAILHCKKSFNGSRESDSSVLPRSVSDPSHEKSTDFSGIEGKE